MYNVITMYMYTLQFVGLNAHVHCTVIVGPHCGNKVDRLPETVSSK